MWANRKVTGRDWPVERRPWAFAGGLVCALFPAAPLPVAAQEGPVTMATNASKPPVPSSPFPELASVAPAGLSEPGRPSQVWGQIGELWSSASRLPDFSRAGYRGGAALPGNGGPEVAATQFGVQADGTTDASAALQHAVDTMPPGVLRLPPGRIVLEKPVTITRSGIMVRGAGAEKTILVIPRSLGQITGALIRPDNKFPYSFSGGFLAVKGRDNGTLLTQVSAEAERGRQTLQVATAAGIKPGQWVRLTLEDKDHSLGLALHGNLADAGSDTYKTLQGKPWIDWAARVVRVDGNSVTLDRPLRLPVKLAWNPCLWSLEPTVQEVGIEELGIEFPGVPKKAHLQEEGFNAIDFAGAVNCWVRNVRITDADNGVLVKGFSRFCTVQDVTFTAVHRTGLTGHHALWASGGAQDNVFADFDLRTQYVHDLTVEGRANGNVFRAGRGVAINLDHHRNAPFENLFTNLEMGDPKRAWQSSGRGDRGPHSAVRTTFWNLKGTKAFPPAPDFPQVNVVGVAVPEKLPNTTALVEPVPLSLAPDLYLAQRQRAGLSLNP